MVSVIHPDSELSVWLSSELDSVSRLIDDQLAGDHESTDALCEQLLSYRGKMLRPSLVLLSAKAIAADGRYETPLRTAAAVLEIIHLATLVHDDVLDEADLRRGDRTINYLKGNEAAVMLGDYLISKAFHLCSTLRDPDLNILLGGVTSTLCTGEILQLHHRENLNLDRATYFRIIENKTGVLISACCRVGGVIAGATESELESLGRFGSAVGIAFQIRDDLIDLTCEREGAGKSVGRDMAKGKPTLPLIDYLEQDNDDPNAILVVTHSREAMRTMLESAGSIQRAWSAVDDLVSSAVQEITSIPASNGVTALQEIARRLTARVGSVGGQPS